MQGLSNCGMNFKGVNALFKLFLIYLLLLKLNAASFTFRKCYYQEQEYSQDTYFPCAILLHAINIKSGLADGMGDYDYQTQNFSKSS